MSKLWKHMEGVREKRKGIPKRLVRECLFTVLLYRKISLCFSYEGFRTPSVHRGRSLPSCTATSVLLSESGPEWKSRDLFF